MEKQPELTLLEQTLEMINVAKTKGFEFNKTKLNPGTIMWEAWMPFEDVFCITACGVIGWWLRKYHEMAVWVESNGSRIDHHVGHLRMGGAHGASEVLNYEHVTESYELALLAITNDALNLLPDINNG